MDENTAQLPVISNPIELRQILSSIGMAAFPFIFTTAQSRMQTNIHSALDPAAEIGTTLIRRRVREKHEVVIRNFFPGTCNKRQYAYLENADQELKIETTDGNTLAGYPYKVRILERRPSVTAALSVTWDPENGNRWKVGIDHAPNFVDFPYELDSTDMFVHLNAFANDAIQAMLHGEFPDFSKLNHLTGQKFSPPPKISPGQFQIPRHAAYGRPDNALG